MQIDGEYKVIKETTLPNDRPVNKPAGRMDIFNAAACACIASTLFSLEALTHGMGVPAFPKMFAVGVGYHFATVAYAGRINKKLSITTKAIGFIAGGCLSFAVNKSEIPSPAPERFQTSVSEPHSPEAAEKEKVVFMLPDFRLP